MSVVRTGQALFVAGAPASGKSTLARAVASGLSWTLLDLDTMTNPLFEHAGGESAMLDSSGPAGRTTINAVRYTCLLDTARDNVAIGNDTVLVAPFTEERASRDAWERRIEHLGISSVAATLVWIDAPAGLILQRMRLRSAARDLARLSQESPIPMESLRVPPVAHLRVDGSAPLDEQVARVLAVMRS